jgi:hypothetical protein
VSVADALDPEPLLRLWHEQRVAHIIIGGVAGAAHGSGSMTCGHERRE